jgi:diguanylate cyclase (GGDEF)-like protein/PAS domain S-box-containing protein
VLDLNLPQDALNEWRGYYDRALQGEKFSVTTHTRFEENPFDMEYHFNPIREENGKITGVSIFGRDITERKRVENALIQSEQLFKSYIQNAPNIITIVDHEDHVRYLNQTEFGLPESTFLGKHIVDFVSAEYRETIKNSLSETRKTGQPSSYVTSTKVGDEVAWYENRAVVIEPQNPSSDVIIISANITNRKQMEEELRKSHEDFQRYFNMGTVGMAVTSPEKGWIEVNDRLCQIFGYSKEELTRLTWADLTHPDDLDANLNLFNQMTAGEIDSFQLDKRYIRKDNSVVFTTIFATCHRNPDGTVRHLLTSMIDITEKKLAEEALNKSEMMYRLLAENVSDVIWILDVESGHFRYVSPSVVGLRGYTPEEVIAQDMSEVLSPASLLEVQQGLSARLQAYQEGDHDYFVSEVEQPRKDGGTVWTETTTSFHINEANGHMEVFGVSRDITERRQNEKLLGEANEKLRSQLKEIELLHQELREQAIRDPLTGLYNRRYMQDVFKQEFSRATRENYPVSVIMLDMDELKTFNDTYGHHAGDQALQSLAFQIQSMTRKEDIVCRYGGDEFTVILSKTFPKDALKRVEEWRKSLHNRPLEIDGKKNVQINFTAGVASFPIHGSTLEEILNYADVALYRAKAQGRNCTLVFK